MCGLHLVTVKAQPRSQRCQLVCARLAPTRCQRNENSGHATIPIATMTHLVEVKAQPRGQQRWLVCVQLAAGHSLHTKAMAMQCIRPVQSHTLWKSKHSPEARSAGLSASGWLPGTVSASTSWTASWSLLSTQSAMRPSAATLTKLSALVASASLHFRPQTGPLQHHSMAQQRTKYSIPCR